MSRGFLKELKNSLNSLYSNLIKIRAFLLVLNINVCVTFRFYATENVGFVDGKNENKFNTQNGSTLEINDF